MTARAPTPHHYFPRSDWSRALDAVGDVASSWMLDEALRYATGFMRSTGFSATNGPAGTVPLSPERTARQFIAEECARLASATTYFVSAEMTATTEVAARSMPDQPLRVTDLPSAFGFVWFDRPLMVTDANGDTVTLRALVWGPIGVADGGTGRPAWMLTAYTDLDSDSMRVEAEAEALREFRTTGRWHSPYLLAHVDSWEVGEGNYGLGTTTLRPYAAALWTLIQQPLAYAEPAPAGRASRKRFERAHGRAPDDVIVVTLRRLRRPADGEPMHREDGSPWYSHRFVVSGHWRNVWHPSTQTHRLQWIDAFTKGPESAPLVVKEKVYRLVR